MSNPEPLSDAYQRSRRNYGFTSGILLVWEFIGISVDQKPFQSINLEIVTPEAVPVLLFLLIVYHGFRTGIEWHQCDIERRLLFPSKLDYRTAHTLGIGSITLYTLQQASGTQLAELLANSGYGDESAAMSVMWIMIVVAGWMLGDSIRAIARNIRHLKSILLSVLIRLTLSASLAFVVLSLNSQVTEVPKTESFDVLLWSFVTSICYGIIRGRRDIIKLNEDMKNDLS